MLLWVNLHASFILGLGLLAVFTIGSMCHGDRQKITQLITVFSVCLVATLLTPYGYRLHVHVYQYLSNGFLMNNIDEFASPNFHIPVYHFFELFIVLTIVGAMLAHDRITTTGLLLLLFSLHAGLYAVRNIPIAAIIMTLVLGPVMTAAVSTGMDYQLRPRRLHSLLEIAQSISDSMVRLERQFRGHALVSIGMIAAVALVLHGGRVFSKQIIAAHFDEKTFPVRAAQFIAQRGIRDHLFSSDSWSGYLIYRLYPETQVYFDDRHDFYGEGFIKEYAKAFLGTRLWREPLDRYQVKWVLVPTDSPLSSVLRETGDWRVTYDDGLATLFSRSKACAP